MVEWFKAHAWKACDVKASAGSNPVLCAIVTTRFLVELFFIKNIFDLFICCSSSPYEALRLLLWDPFYTLNPCFR